MLNSILRSTVGSPSLQVIGKRILQAIPVIVGVSFITFSLLNLLPGGAALALLGPGATKAGVAALNVRLGLNKPFFERYVDWLGNAIQGKFGDSLTSGQPVSSILHQRLPVSLELIAFAFVISIVFAVPVAVLAARKPRGFADRINITVSMAGLSLPSFVFALLLILVVAVHLRLLPAVGFVPVSQGLWPNLKSLILPSTTLAFGLFCTYTRLLRADIVEQMHGEDYIVTAVAKGIGPWRILLRHALRNSMFGLLTLIGLNLGTLIGGTVLIEQIFGLPGIGQQLLQAINNRDVVVVEAIVTIMAVAVVAAALVTDLLYAVLDPRIRYGRPTS
jgi:peptide/nickel transport system permease protein